jgi:ferredoxin/flavodoxin
MSGTSVGIFFFSGTGNTAIVADLLAREFERQGCRISVTAIDYRLLRQDRCGIGDYDLFGIGHPVYAFNAPRIVYDFVRRLPACQGQRTFVFKDSGDPFWRGGATSPLRGRLKRKGYDVFYETLFVMPANVLYGYEDRLVKQLYNKAVARAPVAVGEVLSGQVRLQRNSIFLRGLTWWATEADWLARFFGKDLYATGACTLCGKCAQDCPAGNISIVNRRVRFGWNCLLCMRCIYRCPVGAIKPRLFRPFVLKGGYDIQRVVADPDVPGDFISKGTKGFFARFREYLES